jgi:hypothetical protein
MSRADTVDDKDADKVNQKINLGKEIMLQIPKSDTVSKQPRMALIAKHTHSTFVAVKGSGRLPLLTVDAFVEHKRIVNRLGSLIQRGAGHSALAVYTIPERINGFVDVGGGQVETL